jgi:hypothetical protein
VYRERQFLRLCRRTRIMWRQHQRRGTVGKNQHWQKEIVVHWEELLRKITELLQHRWTAGELNIHLEDPVSSQTVRREVHKSNIHGKAATAKPLITESNAQMRKRRCCVTTSGNAHVIWSDESSFTLFPTSEEFTFGEHPRKPTIRNVWFQQWNTGEVL